MQNLYKVLLTQDNFFKTRGKIKTVHNLLLPQLLAIIPGEISSHCSGDGVDQVKGKEKGSSPEADHKPCQPIHHKAHLGLDKNWLSFLDPFDRRTT